MTYGEIIRELRSLADPKVVAGMARFGVYTDKAFGVRVPQLRSIARKAGKDHALAARLWASGNHEARVLASLIDAPELVTEKQMEAWAADFDAWDICDACCGNLFDKTPFAYRRAEEWSRRDEEFVKRAGFSLMACLAIHDMKAGDAPFHGFLRRVRRHASDPRNFVRKGVNWALRQIGKRNLSLNRAAIKTAVEIRRTASPSARWVAADALRELTSPAVRGRLRRGGARQH